MEIGSDSLFYLVVILLLCKIGKLSKKIFENMRENSKSIVQISAI